MFASKIRPALEELIQRVAPGARIIDVSPFGIDEGSDMDAGTHKGVGYGAPLRIQLADSDGRERVLVFHTATADQFGHDRRADRAAEMLLGFDRFEHIPRHVEALDVGAIARAGDRLISLSEAGEFYLVTRFAEGHVYADDLRRIAASGRASSADVQRVTELAELLAEIHSEKYDDARRYQRALRDLVGSGEGIFGLIDAYAPDVPGAPPKRMQAIELEAVRWRHRLFDRHTRLARTHGDYHPFNIIVSDGGTTLLDASRGCAGDPADDVTCLAINFVFFAVEKPDTWRSAFRELWLRFFDCYLARTNDEDLFAVCAPWLAWRGLVVANPVWYPDLEAGARDRVLALIERTLAAERFDPDMADEVFE